MANEEIEVGNGFVIWLDLLGTNELSSADPIAFLRKWKGLNKIIRGTSLRANTNELYDGSDEVNVRVHAFADTFIISISFKDDAESIANLPDLLWHVGTILLNALKEGSFFRGCITYGLFYRSIVDQVIVGLPVTQAYKYHSMIEWVGISAAPSAHVLINNYFEKSRDHNPYRFHLKEYDIPKKELPDYKGLALDWISNRNKNDIENIRTNFNDRISKTDCMDIAFKLRNTINFIDELTFRNKS